jgi:hypothetical protein
MDEGRTRTGKLLVCVCEYSSKTGKFVRAIGYGVKDGVNKLETCTTTCQAGNPSSPMYYPGHLAIDSNGNLYVGAGSSISVFSMSGGQSKPKVRLAASPIKVEKGHKTTLTGSIEPCSGAIKKGKILFQRRVGGGWDSLGHAVKVDGKCKASMDENTLDTSSSLTVKVK